MSFKEIELPLTMSTTSGDPYAEAIVPLLKSATSYNRGVAYFRSEWIDLAGEGLIEFIDNGGTMKLLTSLELGEKEFNAFKLGQEAQTNEILKKYLVDNLEKTLAKENSWTLGYLSWLIATEKLEVRFSVHKEKAMSIYHDKVSLFYNENEKVCLHGSLNDSMNALDNQETINVFVSWDERDNSRIEEHENYFKKAWEDEVDNYKVYKLPEAIKLEFIRRQNDRNPYKEQKRKQPILPIKEQKEYEIRSYQEDAINALEANGWNGILNMATGTGKTLTSLFAYDKFAENNTGYIVCIVIPQLHLLYQWEKIISEKYPDANILRCAELKTSWGTSIFRYAANKNKKQLFITTTYKTLIDNTFQSGISKYKEKVFYIFDECHKLGTVEIKSKLIINPETKRIGLSATPNRWLDENGNVFIQKVIGSEVYEFSLKKAILEKFLTPYEYYPHFIELTYSEYNDFLDLTKKIGKAQAIAKNLKSTSTNEKIKTLLMQRAEISKSAENKFQKFFQVFDKQSEKKYTIVYVNDMQVQEMVQLLRERYNLNVHGIIAETPIKKRADILAGFNCGEIDIVVAIQCLDEGVDVPNCRYAYILASSTNPREFIQRRGRVLRLAKNKEIGIIHDFVTIAPNEDFLNNEDQSSVIKRELPRVAEFVRLSKNKNDEKLISYLTKINKVTDYVNHNPWELSTNEMEEEENE